MSSQEELRGIAAGLRSDVEELANSITHGIGLVLSVAGAVILVACAWTQGDAWRVAGCLVYASALISVYATSTLSHMDYEPHRKRLFRILDQGFIYLLIAGTYTPFALAYLRTGWWWLFFGVVWTIAFSGFISKVLFAHRVESVSIWLYLLLGWMLVPSLDPLFEVIPAVGVLWMVIGGLCYTLGTVFLKYDRRYYHAIWHVLVVAGSAFHFFAILYFVAPQLA